jgi:hypothetical protein
LDSATVGQIAVSYKYNEHGSMTAMPHLQNMQWDFMERLSHITRGTTEAYYNYDGGGERVRKIVIDYNLNRSDGYDQGLAVMKAFASTMGGIAGGALGIKLVAMFALSNPVGWAFLAAAILSISISTICSSYTGQIYNAYRK